MPSKRKKKDTAPEEHLDAPAATPPPVPSITFTADTVLPPPPESSWQWPDSTETRELIVRHTQADHSRICLEQTATQQLKEDAESEKKSITSEYKARIDKLEEQLSRFKAIVQAGGDKRPVECRWIFEVSGLKDGQWTRNPEYKTLVRVDTGEVVHTVRITEEDRQATLNLGDDEQALEAALHDRGYALNERAEPGEGQSPFYILLTGDAGQIETDVVADNRLGALRAALKATAPQQLADATFSQPYEQGAAAFNAGAERSSVPFDENSTDRVAWLSGYDDEKLEADEAREAA